MSTGGGPREPDFYQPGFNRPNQQDVGHNQGDGQPDLYQSGFNGGQPDFSDVRRDAYQVIPQGKTVNFDWQRDGQGCPIINYGTINMIVDGGGRGGAGANDWQYQQYLKLKDMTSGRYDNWDGDNMQQMRPSDMRRQALIRDGQNQDRMIRSSMGEDPYYDRRFSPNTFDRNGQYTSYAHGGRDGLSYFQSGPTYGRDRDRPWMNNDCFGQGNDDQVLRMVQNALRMGMTFDIARRSANHDQSRWDPGHDRYGDRYDGRMNPMDQMLMAQAINGNNRWDRYSPQIFDPNSTSYSHGGSDGLSFYNSTPSYSQWDGPRSGVEQVLDDVMPFAQSYLAYDIAKRSVPHYQSYANVQPYYRNNNNGDSYSHMAYNQQRQDLLSQQRAQHDAYNQMRRQQRYTT